MVATPFFGPYDVSRSPNVADNQLINLRPEIGEPKGAGKSLGALYGTPGLDLLTTVGDGPINGARNVGGILYVVSGLSVYQVSDSFVGTLIGEIVGNGGLVSMTDNGTQLVIFTNSAAFAAPAGYPLTGAAINAGGINYNIGDTVVLEASNGSQSAAAIITVTGVSGGAVTAFTILQTGAFQVEPTEFVQESTTGSGSGLILTSPTFGGSQALCQIALPFIPSSSQTISCTYQDGFALCNQPSTMNLWQSIIGDLSVWPALNFATADGESDAVNALLEIHRLIFVVKQRSTEVWVNAGEPGFAFQTTESVMIEFGTVSWSSVARIGETWILLSQSSEGEGIVREVEGYNPRRISTAAVETLLASAPTLVDAQAYAYTQEGHQFYVLTLPTGNLTLVYDKTESALAGTPIWYQWLSFSAGQFSRHWGNAFAFFNGYLVLGDYRNGNLYKIDLDTLTDNGTTRKWVRSWRATQQPSKQPRRFDSLQIDMQTGIGIAQGANPQIVLDWSDDGGNNWSDEHYASVGKVGQTALRVLFRRLGSTRRNSGLDRIFRLSSTDQFPVALIGADLDVDMPVQQP
jgi:hypothetical protein